MNHSIKILWIALALSSWTISSAFANSCPSGQIAKSDGCYVNLSGLQCATHSKAVKECKYSRSAARSYAYSFYESMSDETTEEYYWDGTSLPFTKLHRKAHTDGFTYFLGKNKVDEEYYDDDYGEYEEWRYDELCRCASIQEFKVSEFATPIPISLPTPTPHPLSVDLDNEPTFKYPQGFRGGVSYNTEMVEYKNGVISQVNNCGASYSDTGRYLWGSNGHTKYVQSNNETIVKMYPVADGVLSVTNQNKTYFSPDGRYLTGGGDTRYLGVYNRVSAFDDSIYLQNVHTRYSGRGRIDTHSSLKLISDPGQASEKTQNLSINYNSYSFDVVGKIDGNLILKVFHRNAVVGIATASSMEDIAAQRANAFKIIHSVNSSNAIERARIASIKKVLPYNGGAIAYGHNWVVASHGLDNIIHGYDTTEMYKDTANRKIASLLPRGNGNGLMISYTDGFSYFSSDGSNLHGTDRNKTMLITQPWDQGMLDNLLNIRLDPQLAQIYQQYQNNLPAGTTLSPLLLPKSIHFVNRGQNADFAENRYFGNSGTTGFSGIAASVIALDGREGTVDVYNKGWSGWEYKWRHKGKQTGTFQYGYENSSPIGESGIKLVPETCAIIVVVEVINNNIETIDFSWEINADFSLASSNQHDSYGYFGSYDQGTLNLSSLNAHPESLWNKLWSFIYKPSVNAARNFFREIPAGVPLYELELEPLCPINEVCPWLN